MLRCVAFHPRVYRELQRKNGIRNRTLKITSKRGRKFKLSERQKRQLIRCLRALRRRGGTFTCKRVMEEAGIDHVQVSLRTVTRYLNSKGYFYLQARKKGLMSVEDHKKRVKFAKHMRRNYCPDVWKKGHVLLLGRNVSYI